MRKNIKNKELILSRIKIDDVTGCWKWLSCKLSRSGYGMIKLDGVVQLAHRVAFEIWNGKIPLLNGSSANVLHRCDNPPCCNPKHLFVGTQQDNVNDMFLKNRNRPNKGEKNGRAKLSENDVIEIIEKYSTGGFYQRDLADMYGVNQQSISDIVNNKKWVCVKERVNNVIQ